MTKIFIGNFEFEHRLASPSWQMPERLKRLNGELATTWLAIADDGDFLWTPQPIDPQFFRELARCGLPQVIPVVTLEDVPEGTECVPWGWTDDIRRLAKEQHWFINAPPDEAVSCGNSRKFSAALEREWNVGLTGASPVRSLDELISAVDRLPPTSRWVLKADFGMSARERVLGSGHPTESQRNWLRQRISRGEVTYFEPWVERIEEVGIQIDIPQHDPARLIGLAPMLVDPRGQYAGSRFLPPESSENQMRLREWRPAIDVALQVASQLQAKDYFGPLGIDAMKYRDHDGSIRLRPLQDINARWTMGRLALGWRRLAHFPNGGCWKHGTFAMKSLDAQTHPNLIVTSPESFSGKPAHHLSWLIANET